MTTNEKRELEEMKRRLEEDKRRVEWWYYAEFQKLLNAIDTCLRGK